MYLNRLTLKKTKVKKQGDSLIIRIPAQVARNYEIEENEEIPLVEIHRKKQTVALYDIKIRKYGHSLVLLIPADIAKNFKIEENEEIPLVEIYRSADDEF